MHTKIWYLACLDLLYRYVRLLDTVCGHRGPYILRTWRFVEYYLVLRNADNHLGLSPSIHSIDQIKVVDRFRGRRILTLLTVAAERRHIQKYLMKVPWQTWYGQIPIPIRKTLQFLHGMVNLDRI